ARLLGLDALAARLYGQGEIVDLRPGIVVVELARHRPAVGSEHAGQAVANGCAATMADMQRASRIGRDELDLQLASGAAGIAAVVGTPVDDGRDFGMHGRRAEEEIDEART